MRATKSVFQPFADGRLEPLLRDCLALTYNGIHFGDQKGIVNRKGMNEFYRSLKGSGLPWCYKSAVVTRACAVLKSRRKSKKRGVKAIHGKSLAQMVCISSGFFITAKGRLFIPLEKRNQYVDVLLNPHVQKVIEGKEVRSLTIASTSISICYSAEVKPIPIKTVFGVDRNEKNISFGNEEGVVQLDTSDVARINQLTREVVGSFKRCDIRIRKQISSKYWKRARHRNNQLLHAATNFAVDLAKKNGAALACEDIAGIRKMYRRSNGVGPDLRFRMHTWPYGRLCRMLEYKSDWSGVAFIPLTKAETRGSSAMHWLCGERLHEPERGDQWHRRMLRCQHCKQWVDRDINAAIVLSARGLSRLGSSLPQPHNAQQTNAGEEGLAGEALRGNGQTVPILRVDASKLLSRCPRLESLRCGPKS